MGTWTTLSDPAPPPPGHAVFVQVQGREISVFHVDGRLYAVDRACTHAGGPLDEGSLDTGPVVTCPWHGSQFDLRTGAVVEGPAHRPIATYGVRIESGKLVVELP